MPGNMENVLSQQFDKTLLTIILVVSKRGSFPYDPRKFSLWDLYESLSSFIWELKKEFAFNMQPSIPLNIRSVEADDKEIKISIEKVDQSQFTPYEATGVDIMSRWLNCNFVVSIRVNGSLKITKGNIEPLALKSAYEYFSIGRKNRAIMLSSNQ